MKKLYFLNEEESKRILNLHKQATKQQYLSEDKGNRMCEGCGKSDTQQINEVGYFDNWIDVDFTKGTLTLNKYLDCEREGGGSELKLAKGTLFTKKDNELIAANLNAAELVSDGLGTTEEELTGVTVRYFCSTNKLSIDGRNAKFWGEDWPFEVQNRFNDLCSQSELKTDDAAAAANKYEKQRENEMRRKEVESKQVSPDAASPNFGDWSRFPCVAKHPKAKLSKMSNGSEVYGINGVFYYANGRKMIKDDVTGQWITVNYTCNDPEFKLKSNSTVKQLTTPSDAELDAVLGKL